MKSKLKTWMLVTLLLPAIPVSGSNLFKPVEISDAEMATLRGRYVLPQGIVHFGVTMATQWRNSSGASIGAQVNLTVNNLSQAHLTVTQLSEAGNGQLVGNGTGQVIGGQGLSNVQGISQSVRTAGDYNSGENYVDVNISHSTGQTYVTEGQNLVGNQQFNNEAGSVQVSTSNGGLQMNLLANQNQGTASQSLGRGGLAQQANISGSLNQVHNLTTLNVAMRERPSNQGVYCNLRQLGVAPRAGY